MPSGSGDDQAALRQRALRQAIEPVAAELRLIDVVHFIAFIHAEQFGNVRDLVQSSIELFFLPDTLSYGGGADVEIDWSTSPRVILDMEFRHRGVWIVFKLHLRGKDAAVDIEHLSFAGPSESASLDTARMIEAIAAARLPLRSH